MRGLLGWCFVEIFWERENGEIIQPFFYGNHSSVTAHSRKISDNMILRDSGTDREDLANAMSDGIVIIIIVTTIYWQYFFMVALHLSYWLNTNDLHNNVIQKLFTVYIMHLKTVKTIKSKML